MRKYRCIIIGGGWAGCAAALTAAGTGCQVTLIERTDLAIGLGNVGGIMRNNGRFTAAEENRALGAGSLFDITDRFSVHKNVDFPGHEHGWFYNALRVEPAVRKLLKQRGINLRFQTRAVDVKKEGDWIKAVVLEDGEEVEGEVFIDTTGSSGPMGNCLNNGNGCSMCILRCPAFGPRVSISQRAGGEDIIGQRDDGSYGAFSGSCKLTFDSLSEKLKQQLKDRGVAIVPLPEVSVKKEKLSMKVCSQYALEHYAENIILIHTGDAKMMTPFFNLEDLRKVPGFEEAKFNDPYAGTKGNSIRYMAVARRDNAMKVKGVANLFCGGEKSGFFVGHTEAITTGSLAGYNAGRFVGGKEPLILPKELAVGRLIALGNSLIDSPGGNKIRLTFAGEKMFQIMKEEGLYSVDREKIQEGVRALGMENVYKEV